MVCYCDASVLCKAFVRETGPDRVIALLGSSGRVLVNRLGLAEVAAGLARAQREGRLPLEGLAVVLRALGEQVLDPLDIVDPTAEVCVRAVSLVARHPLKASDAVHLASALDGGADLFVCSDRRLLAAAEAEGLSCLDPTDDAQPALADHPLR
jgi:uncharacterized protein